MLESLDSARFSKQPLSAEWGSVQTFSEKGRIAGFSFEQSPIVALARYCLLPQGRDSDLSRSFMTFPSARKSSSRQFLANSCKPRVQMTSECKNISDERSVFHIPVI